MVTVLSAVEGGTRESATGFELAYVEMGGDEVRVGLADAAGRRPAASPADPTAAAHRPEQPERLCWRDSPR
ncbi:hypothetical protein IU459_35960 [Nocardia amamiensis]|uniref:Uncharacterized protein n=1 Tax=Nocardia amamiensis TaxID=404578 RepID=A0ABS0D209_9NOCA|nr:hypothetical protein [Nocardia amamiensis]MBF6302877.1 hypothetical protein [Nocardia amamiensis]